MFNVVGTSLQVLRVLFLPLCVHNYIIWTWLIFSIPWRHFVTCSSSCCCAATIVLIIDWNACFSDLRIVTSIRLDYPFYCTVPIALIFQQGLQFIIFSFLSRSNGSRRSRSQGDDDTHLNSVTDWEWIHPMAIIKLLLNNECAFVLMMVRHRQK